MNTLLLSIVRHAGWIAAALCAGAGLAYGGLLAGYAHASHPLALLGAKGVPRAMGFNVLGLVLPGLLVALVAWRVRAGLPRHPRWTARLGAQMLWLSALAFAAQGVFRLDPADLDGPASGRHAAAWMLWWIAFATGGLLLAAGLRTLPAQRGFAATTQVLVVLVLAFALGVPWLGPAGIAQRFAFALWFAWAIAAGAAVSRSAASMPGSSPTAPG